MKTSTAPKRKTGRMIAKNLILLLVVVLIATLAIWAWFAQNQSATAEGINVKAKAEGVEVSWTGTNDSYYKDLTALNQSDVVKSQTGLAKELDESKSSLKLITGNGINFFEPLLNRRTGEPIKKSDNSWEGSVVTDADGKYVDVPLYFRSTSERSIYLTGKSAVSPRSTSERMSEYGNFSKDYICSAARVAFLNSTKNKCNFIWAPNSNYQLVQNDAGFTKLTTTMIDRTETTSSSDPQIPDSILTEDTAGSTKYYFWTPSNYSSDNDSMLSYMVANEMSFQKYKGEKGLYIVDYVIKASSRKENTTYPFIVNTNGSSYSGADINTYVDSNTGKRTQYNDSEALIQFSSEYNITIGGTSYSAPAYYIKSGFQSSDELHIIFGYNPTLKQLIILGYHDEHGHEYDLSGTTSIIVTETKYYPIENNTTLALANAESALAVSANDSKEKSIRFSNSAKTNIFSSSVTSKEIFTAKIVGTADEEHPSKNKFTFMNSSTNSYLTISGSDISFTAAGTQFYLTYEDGISGPVLKTEDDLCLAYVGNRFRLVTPDELTENNFVTIYTGSTYSFNTQSTATQTYEYYRNGDTACTTLNTESTPPLFPSATTDNEEKIISMINADTAPIPIVELKKAKSTDEYATGSIIIRIWAEGTDRDAKTPLADGKFEVDLHFTSILPTNS